MDWLLVLGLTAAIFTTSSGIPQLIKAAKTKSTKDLSLGMFVILSIGVLLWLIYGIITKDAPIIAANAITLIGSLSLLMLKIKYK